MRPNYNRHHSDVVEQPPDYDDDDFPIFVDIFRTREKYVATFRPGDVDDFAEEVRKQLETCRFAEADDPNKDRTELLMGTLWNFLMRFLRSRAINGDKNEKALYNLVIITITTPRNLENLLCALDANVRTGMPRCCAAEILEFLTMSVRPAWNMTLPSGRPYLTELLVNLCKSLDDDSNKSKKISHDIAGKGKKTACRCVARKWVLLDAALLMTKEKPAKVLESVASCNWPMMFQLDTPSVAMEQINIFETLHRMCTLVLQIEKRNFKVESFLRMLGRCHDLFRRVLQLVITGHLFPATATAKSSHGMI